ncbi:MAG: uracil-DNA glycosylase [Pseudomonadota bacterium]|uniref:uracil-DNA glycosylase n=1 Tax=Methylophaga TaxID=40222 RepID=UPI0017615411|nr:MULTISPECIES: uracil-DNA glycosylase [Methylophaga]MEC9412875.1 uracil-DNA glycosylase [Pseudomonadota bacterium]WVI86069.1 uracil-DNA glycosylase [Methylophaga thalassica]HIC46220.1 uracil-DNA glycosylase [Methylophaga sp.]HIM40929.1 uracil-DNA glycosylase [Methylophaga aminisulfidivorans]
MVLEHAPSWQAVLAAEFNAPYMQDLKAFLRQEKDQQKKIYPHSADWFHALETTPLDEVKVVILGQDPYHQPGQAHGLCFSVKPGVKVPPSLVNIYKELESDLGVTPVKHGYLESWAKQGVLLLNAVLTVEDSNANAHQGKGWEQFTDKVIETINERCEHVVFMLWGSYAQKKGSVIDPQRHLVLKAPHPSPLSAHRGFLGCRHFSQANDYLVQHGKSPINWQLPDTVS